MIHTLTFSFVLGASVFLSVANAAPGDAPADQNEINRRLDILAKEIEQLKMGDANVAPSNSTPTGMGPSASKVYLSPRRSVSIGGYGEMLYQNFKSENDAGTTSTTLDQIDFVRSVLYVGYRFNDSFLFNSEIEVEHGSTNGGGEVSAEFAYVDWFHNSYFNVRAGLLLIPMGLLNEMHEPTTYSGARRTETETVIMPSTWRENGIGGFGEFGNFTYRTYITNGMNAAGFTGASLRSGRQRGINAKVDGGNWAWTTRMDFVGTQGLLVGGSTYFGQTSAYTPLSTATAGPTTAVTTVAKSRMSIYEAHVDWKSAGIELRGLAAMAKVGSPESLNTALALTGENSIGEELWGAYLQVGYDVLAGAKGALTPFVRMERVSTQASVPSGFSSNPRNLYTVMTYGLSYKPIDAIVVKVDYQNYDRGDRSGLDQVNAALGYNF